MASASWVQLASRHVSEGVAHRQSRGLRPCLLQVDAVDTNGAGDTFATAYMLALARRDRHPGTTANWAAARTVSQAQVRASARGTNTTLSEGLARLL